MMRMLLCLFLTAAITPASAAENENPIVQVKMKDMLDSRSPAEQVTGPLAGISVTVQAARQQAGSEKGLQLDVVIRNNGAQSLSLEDPGEFIQIQLLDSKGYPVDLPSIPTGRFVCTQPGSTERSSDTDARRPFQLVRPQPPQTVKSNDNGLQSEPRVVAGRLFLPAGREYRMTLQIHRILADPAGYLAAQEERARRRADLQTPPAASPAAIAIPPGRYTAHVQIALVPTAGGEGSRHLYSDAIVVNFTSPPSAQHSRRQ